MRSQTVSILEGNNFVVSDIAGDIDASPSEPHGLFTWDTRYLSRWQLRIDNQSLDPLTTTSSSTFRRQFFLVPSTGSIYTNATMAVVRKRSVGDGFHEDLTIQNYGTRAITLQVRLEAAADFADLFEVKDALPKKVSPTAHEDGRLVLGYRREHFVRETWISASAPEARLDSGASFAIEVARPRGMDDVHRGRDGADHRRRRHHTHQIWPRRRVRASCARRWLCGPDRCRATTGVELA